MAEQSDEEVTAAERIKKLAFCRELIGRYQDGTATEEDYSQIVGELLTTHGIADVPIDLFSKHPIPADDISARIAHIQLCAQLLNLENKRLEAIAADSSQSRP